MSVAVLGIDLGTTFSCVAYIKDNKPEVLPNGVDDTGIFPSVVHFKPGEPPLVAHAADQERSTGSNNTIHGIKRIIGVMQGSSSVSLLDKQVEYEIVSDKKKRPRIKLDEDEFKDFRLLSPEEISAIVLLYMKKRAEAHWKTRFNQAVITIPAYFDECQRTSTKIAAQIAGFEVLGLLAEPTAAAIYYFQHFNKDEAINKDEPKKLTYSLVFDLGGGTFDVSLLLKDPKCDLYSVQALSGDSLLGGEDFDHMMMDYCIDEFKKQFGITVHKELSSEEYATLKDQVVYAKHTLSKENSATVTIEHFSGDNHMNVTITQEKLREICTPLLDRIRQPLDEVCEDVEMEEIGDIIMVGGSTRMPLIRTFVEQYFNKQIRFDLDVDQAVAIGAAYQAQALALGRSRSEISVSDCVPMSIGILTYSEHGDFVDYIIPKQTKTPCRFSKVYSNPAANVTKLSLSICQGDNPDYALNRVLGKTVIEGLRPLPAEQAKIKVEFEVDSNGILTMNAKDITPEVANSDAKAHLVIESNRTSSLEPIEVAEIVHSIRKIFDDETSEPPQKRTKN